MHVPICAHKLGGQGGRGISRLPAKSGAPHVGLHPRTLRSCPEPKAAA